EDEQLEEPLAEIEPLAFELTEPAEENVMDLSALDGEPELPAASEAAETFSFELGELEELPALESEEVVAAPLFDAAPESAPALEEPSFHPLAETPQWDERELAELDLTEVERPGAPGH